MFKKSNYSSRKRNKNKYLCFPLKWFSSDLVSIRKVRGWEVISRRKKRFVNKLPMSSVIFKGAAWEVKYCNKTRTKEVRQLWIKGKLFDSISYPV